MSTHFFVSIFVMLCTEWVLSFFCKLLHYNFMVLFNLYFLILQLIIVRQEFHGKLYCTYALNLMSSVWENLVNFFGVPHSFRPR